MKIEKVSVVVPVYNEEEAIAGDLRTIIKAMDESGRDYEVIVVNDASTDNTAEVVAQFPDVQLITHRQNRGGGFSRNTGIKASTGDVFVVTDGDATYPNQDIPRLLDTMEAEDLDMVVGARKKESGTLKFIRGPVKWFIRKLAEVMSGFKIPDLNSGLRAIRRDVFMRYMEILPWGHSWVSTITLAMLAGGYQVDFVEIDYYPRKGQSTFHPIKDTSSYLTLVIRTVTWFNPLKVFMPVAIILGILGTWWFIVDVIHWNLRTGTVLFVLAAIQVAAIGLLADLISKRGG
ncbi:MAG TPA: DPM/DPG synthase family glycosyltransferase [Candidatus Anoxymicrobiaceae bacterium]